MRTEQVYKNLNVSSLKGIIFEKCRNSKILALNKLRYSERIRSRTGTSREIGYRYELAFQSGCPDKDNQVNVA